MGIPRRTVLLKIAGKRKGIGFHLDNHIPKLLHTANRGLLQYWNREVANLISEMEFLAWRLPKNEAILNEVTVYRQRLQNLIDSRLRQLGEQSLEGN